MANQDVVANQLNFDSLCQPSENNLHSRELRSQHNLFQNDSLNEYDFESDIPQEESTIVHSSAGLYWARIEYLETGDIIQLMNSYATWVDQAAYVIVENEDEPGTFKSFRAAKRGDSFYAYKTLGRFESAMGQIEGLDVRAGHSSTQAVDVTLTYAEQRELNWKLISPDFNRFMARLRKRYGTVNAIRIWETHKSGYPHVHVVLLFENTSWTTFLYKGKYRLDRSSELKECWPYGFSDWQGVYDLEGSLQHLKKYLTKLLQWESDHALLNLAKLWIHKKRSFSVSRRLDNGLCNSNQEIVQELLEGEPVPVRMSHWRLICVVASMVDLTKVRIQDVTEVKTSRSIGGTGGALQHIINYIPGGGC